MALTRSEMEKILKLAKLSVTEKTLSDTQTSISQVLQLIEQMHSVNTSGIEPLFHPLEMACYLRDDEPQQDKDPKRYQKNAPQTHDGFYLVPKAVE